MKPWGRVKPTRKQKKLLRYMAKTSDSVETIDEMCRNCGVSKKVYYNLLESDEFADLLAGECTTLVRSEILPIVKKICDQAKRGGPKQQEYALRMANLLPSPVANETKILNIFPQSGNQEALPSNEDIQRMITWQPKR